MATTESNITVTSATQLTYGFTFPYLKTTDVKLSINGVAKTFGTGSGQWQFANATTIQLNSNPTVGDKIRIYRETDDSKLEAEFFAGSAIKSSDLNDNFNQNLYVTQESNNKIDAAWTSGDETIDSDETWASNNTRIATTGAIDARVDSKIDTALTTDIAAGNKITVTDNSPGSGQITVALTTGSLVNSDVNASAAIAGTKISPDFGSQNIATTGTVDGRDVSTDGAKLDNIESNATADQTASEIRTLVGNATDSNVFTDNFKTKLDGIETAATGDQTNAEIRAAVAAATDSNVFTDADHLKLDGIESSATADQTAGEIKTLIASSPLDNSHLAADSVRESEIKDGEITAAKLSPGTVVTNSEQSSASVNDTSFFTTSASDARYFNVSTGDTIKDGEAFPDNDTTIATTAAINDRIIDLVDDVGGFVAIANETSFPNANPDINNGTGTIVSIGALAGNLTSNGSGEITIANGTVGNSTVTITGAANSTTYSAGYGMLVETTTTLNTYTFHRLSSKATEVTTVATNISNVNAVGNNTTNINAVADNSTNINTVAGADSNISSVAGSISNVNTVATNISNVNDFSDKYRVASSAPTSSLDVGDLYFDTSANELKVYNGSAWQGGVTATGNLAGLGANTFTGSQSLGDNNKVIFGTGNDLQIYHDGTNNYIKHVTSGAVYIETTTNLNLRVNSNENAIIANANGSVDLYYDNSKKFETTSVGGLLTGKLEASNGFWCKDNATYRCGDGTDLMIYHDGTDSIISNATNVLKTHSSHLFIRNAAGNEDIAKFVQNGSVELYYDNVKKLETASDRVNITGHMISTGTVKGAKLSVDDNNKATFGDSDDLQIYHSGSDSWIRDTGTGTGNLYLDTNGDRISLISDGSESNGKMAKFIKDGAVELYHNNALRFNTSSSGVDITGELYIPDNTNIKIGAGGDLLIYHNGSHSYIKDAGTGALNICSSALYVTNAADSENMIAATENGAVNLYYDGSKKIETSSTGVIINGKAIVGGNLELNSDAYLKIGASNDLQIFHNGSNSYIDNATGQLTIRADQVRFLNAVGSENFIDGNANGSVDIYYDGSKKFETTSSGVTVTGTVSDSKGNLRSIPQQNEQGSAHTLVAADAGKHILADATVTAPPTSGIFSAGDAITIINTSGSDISIARGSGVTMYNSADGTDADRTLGTKGMATILCAGSNTYYISGAGLS